MIQSILFTANGEHKTNLPLDELKAALLVPENLLWVSLENTHEAEAKQVLGQLFQFHSLAIEDCMTNTYQTSKVDDYGSYLFIIANGLKSNKNFTDLETDELNLFLGDNFLVTSYLSEVMPPIQKVFQRLSRDERLYTNGSDFLCHAVLDNLVDEYMPIIDQMDDEIEWLEDQVLAKPVPETLERILTLKHSVMKLRRIISPQRETINRLTRDEFPMIDRQSRIYFRDIYDHLVRIQDLSESIRDIVSGAMDIYLNSTSLRLNEIMKALTIVSTIFLPLSFIAGVYGMNFQHFPEITWNYGYYMIWGIFILVAVSMLIFFKKRGWF